MKKWILQLCMVSVLGILAASCSQIIDDPTTGDCEMEKEKVMIRFTIVLDELKAASRSWDGYDYEDENKADEQIGSAEENKINNVHALLYDLNGVLMYKLDDPQVTVDESSEKRHVYTVIGSIEADADEVSNMNFKLMVFANCNLPSDLRNSSDLVFNSWKQGIPMWGIATYEGVDLSGHTTVDNAYDLTETADEKNPVYMLRSMAKIEVTLEEESAKTYRLTDAATQVKESGYVMPKLRLPDGTTDLSIGGLTSTKQLGIDEVFNPMTNDEMKSGNFEGSNNTYYIYVPEYDATNNGLIIHLTLSDLADNTKTLEKSFTHGSYNEDGTFSGSAWNVIRNHYYKYEVSIMKDLNLKVSVAPYGSYDLNPGFGL